MIEHRRLCVVVVDRSSRDILTDIPSFKKWMHQLGIGDDDFLSVQVSGTNGYTALHATLGYSRVIESLAAPHDPGPLFGPDIERIRQEMHTAMTVLEGDGFSLRPEVEISGTELFSYFRSTWADELIPFRLQPSTGPSADSEMEPNVGAAELVGSRGPGNAGSAESAASGSVGSRALVAVLLAAALALIFGLIFSFISSRESHSSDSGSGAVAVTGEAPVTTASSTPPTLVQGQCLDLLALDTSSAGEIVDCSDASARLRMNSLLSAGAE